MISFNDQPGEKDAPRFGTTFQRWEALMARRSMRVFFPWERRRGLLGLLGRARVKIVLGVAAVVVLIVVVRRREENAAAMRATRAALTTTSRAIAAFRADHGGACPKELGELVAGGYAYDVPLDAWGRPVRYACPGRRDPQGFDVWSDGPDGVSGGLDRVE
jgi:general secretion pathway protein G